MIKNGLIVGLAILAIFLFLLKIPAKVITNTKVDTIITHQTFTKYTKGDKIPFKVLDTIIQSTHDTIKIIEEFNEFIVYRDSINQDSNLYVIQDTVHQNKIIGRSFDSKIQKKTIVITNTIQPKYKANLYLGFRSDLSHDYTKVNHNISLTLKTRHKGLYTVGYGMAGYSVGYSFKF
jgi:hypothetical protein